MGRSGILFAPLLVYAKLSNQLLLKFVLTILFPLSVLMLYWKEAIRDRYYNIGLLLFAVGAIQSYLLAEDGLRMFAGNFFWSGQLGLFLWFVVSMRFVLKKIFSNTPQPRQSMKLAAIYAAFTLHVVSGLVWYAAETFVPGAFW